MLKIILAFAVLGIIFILWLWYLIYLLIRIKHLDDFLNRNKY